MKKVFLGILLLICLGVGVFAYFELNSKAEISTELSTRSKEFLDKRRRESEDPLFYANLNEKEVEKGSGEIIVDTCFKMVVPFKIGNVRQDGDCDYTLQIERPRGNIIAYQRSEKIISVDQVPGVGMRRQSAHAYKESEVIAPIGRFVVFEKKLDGYEKNAFYFDGASTYIVVNMLGGDESYSKDFEKLLGSIQRL